MGGLFHTNRRSPRFRTFIFGSKTDDGVIYITGASTVKNAKANILECYPNVELKKIPATFKAGKVIKIENKINIEII